MKKFVVTGGCGFIGSHLVESLLQLGHKVVVIDNLSTGFLSYLPKHPNLIFVNVDISNWTELSKCFSYFHDVDCLFHLAACARIQPSIFQPLLTHDTNITGTLNILEMMRMCGVKNIIYSASSSSYGLNPTLPCKESQAENCQTPYAISKYMGELYCKTWGRLYKIHNICLKYFNVYGRRSPLSGPYAPVVGLFFRQAIFGENITVVGDGSQKRDFTHVSDVVRANLLAMTQLRGSDFDLLDGKTINIGTGKNYSISQIATMVKDCMVGSMVNIVNVSERIGETKETLADISLAKELLEWYPEVVLEDGLKDLYMYYINNIKLLRQGKFDI